MIKKMMSKIDQWFNEPIGNAVEEETSEVELKERLESFEAPFSSYPRASKKIDFLKFVPKQIRRFYPRGTAGHREGHGSVAAHKANMPNHGNRTNNPNKPKF